MAQVTTILYPPGSILETELTYVVMGALYKGSWIFVRHRDRMTWEMPAGHIEPGESADQAAARELYEEAGVIKAALVHLCDYAVQVRDKTENGRLYSAEVHSLEPTLEHEMVERQFSIKLPGALTYPEVQTILFNRLKQHF